MDRGMPPPQVLLSCSKGTLAEGIVLPCAWAPIEARGVDVVAGRGTFTALPNTCGTVLRGFWGKRRRFFSLVRWGFSLAFSVRDFFYCNLSPATTFRNACKATEF